MPVGKEEVRLFGNERLRNLWEQRAESVAEECKQEEVRRKSAMNSPWNHHWLQRNSISDLHEKKRGDDSNADDKPKPTIRFKIVPPPPPPKSKPPPSPPPRQEAPPKPRRPKRKVEVDVFRLCWRESWMSLKPPKYLFLRAKESKSRQSRFPEIHVSTSRTYKQKTYQPQEDGTHPSDEWNHSWKQVKSPVQLECCEEEMFQWDVLFERKTVSTVEVEEYSLPVWARTWKIMNFVFRQKRHSWDRLWPDYQPQPSNKLHKLQHLQDQAEPPFWEDSWKLSCHEESSATAADITAVRINDVFVPGWMLSWSLSMKHQREEELEKRWSSSWGNWQHIRWCSASLKSHHQHSDALKRRRKARNLQITSGLHKEEEHGVLHTTEWRNAWRTPKGWSTQGDYHLQEEEEEEEREDEGIDEEKENKLDEEADEEENEEGENEESNNKYAEDKEKVEDNEVDKEKSEVEEEEEEDDDTTTKLDMDEDNELDEEDDELDNEVNNSNANKRDDKKGEEEQNKADEEEEDEADEEEEIEADEEEEDEADEEEENEVDKEEEIEADEEEIEADEEEEDEADEEEEDKAHEGEETEADEEDKAHEGEETEADEEEEEKADEAEEDEADEEEEEKADEGEEDEADEEDEDEADEGEEDDKVNKGNDSFNLDKIKEENKVEEEEREEDEGDEDEMCENKVGRDNKNKADEAEEDVIGLYNAELDKEDDQQMDKVEEVEDMKQVSGQKVEEEEEEDGEDEEDTLRREPNVPLHLQFHKLNSSYSSWKDSWRGAVAHRGEGVEEDADEEEEVFVWRHSWKLCHWQKPDEDEVGFFSNKHRSEKSFGLMHQEDRMLKKEWTLSWKVNGHKQEVEEDEM